MKHATRVLAALVLLSCCSGKARAGLLTLGQSQLLQLNPLYENPSGEGTTSPSKAPSGEDVLFAGTLGTTPGTPFYPFAQIGIGADPLAIVGTRDLAGYDGFALDFTNLGADPVFVGVFMTTGSTFQFYQSGFVVLPSGRSGIAVLDFNAKGVQDLDQVKQIGLQIGADVGNNNTRDYQVLVGSVPEPATLTLLGIGLAGLAGYGWRRGNPA